MNLNDIRNSYLSDNHEFLDASSKTCQDVILYKISQSPLAKNITIKGGIIIQYISNDKRRATRDFDLDFIKYSLSENAIKMFIDTLNKVDDGIIISIVKPIEELHHQEYKGKRVIIELVDVQNNKIETKLDIGVHQNIDIEQEEYCFNLNSIGENVKLFINSKEQIFTEKLKSLLKLGVFSTRYKDIFDLYYLISIAGLNKNRLINCFTELIFSKKSMKENNIYDIYKRLHGIFQNKLYLEKAGTARNNWLELPIIDVTEKILSFFKE